MPRDPERLKQFWTMVYRWFLARGFHHDKAEEWAQELSVGVPTDVLEGSPARWRLWLRTAARNKSFSYLRRTYSEKKALEEYFRRWNHRSSRVPITDADTERVLSAVGETLSRLDGDERYILHLRYWLQYSSQEIAEALTLGVATARKRLQRARDRFEEEWNEDPQVEV